MNLFGKIGVTVLSTIALGSGIVTAIPATRNFILNSVAPYSEVYQQQKEELDKLNESYVSNLVLLAETRTSLLNAEFKSISYQNEVGVLTNTLTTTQANLSTTVAQKTVIENDLKEANKNYAKISNELAELRQQYYQLNSQLNTLIENNGSQLLIDELNAEIDNLYQNLYEKESINNSLVIAIDTYEQRLRDNENLIANYERIIDEQQQEIISLNSQIVELRDTIRELESLNSVLNGDDSYKIFVNEVISGTVSEIKASDLEGITEIRPYAFYGCNNLISVELPEGIETIGDYAFANCNNLRDVYISSTTRDIGNHTFENCKNLRSINLENIEMVGSFAFMNAGLEEIYLPSSINNWSSCIFQSAHLRTVYFADGTTDIPFGTFINCPIEEMYVPSTLQNIEGYTFGYSNTPMTIYYQGSAEEYSHINIENDRNDQVIHAVVIYNFQY